MEILYIITLFDVFDNFRKVCFGGNVFLYIWCALCFFFLMRWSDYVSFSVYMNILWRYVLTFFENVQRCEQFSYNMFFWWFVRSCWWLLPPPQAAGGPSFLSFRGLLLYSPCSCRAPFFRLARFLYSFCFASDSPWGFADRHALNHGSCNRLV